MFDTMQIVPLKITEWIAASNVLTPNKIITLDKKDMEVFVRMITRKK